MTANIAVHEKKNNIVEAEQRFEQTSLSSRATARCTVSVVDLSKYKNHKNVKIFET